MLRNPLKNIGRHREMVSLLYKYGTTDIVQKSGLAEALSESSGDDADGKPSSHDWPAKGGSSSGEKQSVDPTPEELARDLESMGPTFIKLGQLLSTRPDFLPVPYLDALARLQDDVDPIEAREIFRVIEQELGKQPEHLFASFDVKPLATASLGQVHRATMHDGRDVVVKIQRPEVTKIIASDIEAMEELAAIAETFEFSRKYQLKHMVESLKHSLTQELSYENEARNANMLRENLCDFKNIIVPKVIDSLSTDKVITTEYVECEKITEMDSTRLDTATSKRLANELFESFLHQVLVHGAFHADPHPGNVALMEDGRIVLMDHGLVVTVPKDLQNDLIKLLLAISEGNGQIAAEIAESVGLIGDNFNSEKFRADIKRIVAENVNRSVEQMDTGAALMKIQQASGNHDLTLPQEVILLGRSLMHLERVVSALDPEFNPNEAVRDNAMEIMQEHSGQAFTLTKLYQTFLESSEFAQQLPSRANKFAELVSTNGLEFKVNSINEDKLMNGLNKVANRITAGLIIAAMIIGASLMMRMETTFTWFGYPVIAFFFFLLAALAGSVLVWKAIVTDNFEK